MGISPIHRHRTILRAAPFRSQSPRRPWHATPSVTRRMIVPMTFETTCTANHPAKRLPTWSASRRSASPATSMKYGMCTRRVSGTGLSRTRRIFTPIGCSQAQTYTLSFHVRPMARIASRRQPDKEEYEERLASPWRKWVQAGEALDRAHEAEEYQSVGMRCRESLVALMKELASPGMVPSEQEAPKAADFVQV